MSQYQRNIQSHNPPQVPNGNFEIQAINETFLKWSSFADGQDSVVVHGESDFAVLRNLKNILLNLQT